MPTRPDTDKDLSPGLRRQITAAARRIHAAHEAELADALAADRAAQLFRKIISPNSPPQTAGGSREIVAAVAGEMGGLWNEAIRAGSGILAGPLTVLSQAWLATITPAAAVPEAAETGPEEAALLEMFRQFLPMVVASLNQGGDGYGLAETVIALFGRQTYDQAAGLGKEKIMRLVKAEPDLWAQVAPIEARFDSFLDEFTGYDARRQRQSAERQPGDGA
jgi:hypothetical protein